MKTYHIPVKKTKQTTLGVLEHSLKNPGLIHRDLIFALFSCGEDLGVLLSNKNEICFVRLLYQFHASAMDLIFRPSTIE